MVSFRAIAKRLPPGGAEWPCSSEICHPGLQGLRLKKISCTVGGDSILYV